MVTMCTITMFVNYLVKGLLHNGIDPVTKAESKKIGSLTIPALNTVREYFNISSEEYLPTITSEDLNLTIKLCYSYIYDSGAIESRKGHLRDREWVVLKFVDTLKTRKKKVMPFWLSDDGEFVFYKKYLKSEVWKAKKDIVYNIYGKICSRCPSTKFLQVHHLTYDRLGFEHIEKDLIPLCGTCHQKDHHIFHS